MIAGQIRIPLLGGTFAASANACIVNSPTWNIISSANFLAGDPSANLPAWLRFHRVTIENQGSIAMRFALSSQMDGVADVTDYPDSLGIDVLPGATRTLDMPTLDSSVGIRRILYLVDIRSSPITNMWQGVVVLFRVSGEFYNVAQSAVP